MRRPTPAATLQDLLAAVAAGEGPSPLGRGYAPDEIVPAHRDIEAGVLGGKAVVLT